ncbi:MAG: WxcM-like domain-containing protein [Ginsengibacter sp.]
MKATLIEGGIYTDSRGILRYVNEEDPGYYRRFYLITHNDIEVVRAWQGHKKEEKAFYVISGTFTIAVVNPTSFETPSDDEKPDFFQLTEENKNFLRVPGGSYTGIKATSPNSTLLVLSSMDLKDSKADDYRQPSSKWVDWSTIKNTPF